MVKRGNLRRYLFIGFYLILFILIMLEKSLLAVTFCALVFLLTSAIVIQGFIKRLKSGRISSQLTGKEAREREFLILMIFGSFFSTFIVIIGGFIAKFFTGISLFIIFLVLLIDLTKRVICRKKLHGLLKRLNTEPSVGNYEKVIDTYLSLLDFTSASIYGDKAIKQYPDSAVLLTWRAIVYRRSEEDEKAVPLIKRAFKIDPHNKFVRGEGYGLQSLGFKVFPPPKSFWKLWP